MVSIIEGKDLIWDVDNYDVILVGTSIYNLLTQGFQSKMAVRYPELVTANNQTPYADNRKMGKRITVELDNGPTVSLMYICGYPHSKRVFLDYDALENCMATANAEFKGKRVACPFLGTSRFDGNGDRGRCMDIIKRKSDKIDLTVYDFPQYNRRVEIAQVLSKWNPLKKSDPRKYEELLSHRDEIIAKLYLKH